MSDETQVASAWQYVPIGASLICAIALILLWVRRRSVLDLWLMVVLCTSLIEIFLLAFLSSGRFSVGWWAGRFYGLISASTVLLVLLSETMILHAPLALAVSAERRTRDARLTTMEALSASIAHEVNQPLASMVTNADAGLRWLERAHPDMDEARSAFKRIVCDGHCAGKVIESIRTMFVKGPQERIPLDRNALITEVLNCSSSEAQLARVSIETDLREELPFVTGNLGPDQRNCRQSQDARRRIPAGRVAYDVNRGSRSRFRSAGSAPPRAPKFDFRHL
jgi:signal transduction histidine kinase